MPKFSTRSVADLKFRDPFLDDFPCPHAALSFSASGDGRRMDPRRKKRLRLRAARKKAPSRSSKAPREDFVSRFESPAEFAGIVPKNRPSLPNSVRLPYLLL